MKAFFLQGSWEPLFCREMLICDIFARFGQKNWITRWEPKFFSMFALGAEAAFYWCLGVSLLFIMKVKVSNRGQGQK